MNKATSTTIKNDTPQNPDNIYQTVFILENGNNGEKTITSPFLDNDAIAGQKAKSEFLQYGYKKRKILFSTYITNFSLNIDIKILGVNILLKSINIKGDAISIESSIGGVRYEI